MPTFCRMFLWFCALVQEMAGQERALVQPYSPAPQGYFAAE